MLRPLPFLPITASISMISPRAVVSITIIVTVFTSILALILVTITITILIHYQTISLITYLILAYT